MTPRSFDQTHNGEVNSLDAFVVKLKPDGSGLEFATFLGGQCNEAVTGIALDDDDRIFVTGSTVSDDFPTTAKAYDRVRRGDEDVFVSELSADGRKLLASTYLGGKGLDWAQGIALGKAGDVTVTGWTKSGDFPTTPARVRPPLPRWRGRLRRATRHRRFPSSSTRPTSAARGTTAAAASSSTPPATRTSPARPPPPSSRPRPARAPRRTSATRTPSSPS